MVLVYEDRFGTVVVVADMTSPSSTAKAAEWLLAGATAAAAAAAAAFPGKSGDAVFSSAPVTAGIPGLMGLSLANRRGCKNNVLKFPISNNVQKPCR